MFITDGATAELGETSLNIYPPLGSGDINEEGLSVLGSAALGNLSELWDCRESHEACGAAASDSSVKWPHAADILYFLLSPFPSV